jgi:hypothetical protein
MPAATACASSATPSAGPTAVAVAGGGTAFSSSGVNAHSRARRWVQARSANGGMQDIPAPSHAPAVTGPCAWAATCGSRG